MNQAVLTDCNSGPWRREDQIRWWQDWRIILAVAIGIRLAWASLVPVVPISDSAAYHAFAKQLASGDCFGWEPGKPTAFWPVGTAFIYSVAYRASGGFFGAVFLNLTAGVAGVMLTVAVVRKTLDTRTAAVAGWLMAIWPWHVEFTTVLASELFFTALMLAGMLCWMRCRYGHWLWAVAAGVIFAADAYVRPTALLIPVALSGVDFFRGPGRLRTFVLASCVGVVMATCIAPWSARNIRVFGQFVAISTNAGSNLWMGNNPSTNGFYMQPPTLDASNEATNDRLLGRDAREFIRAAPFAFVKRSVIKLLRLHERQTIGVEWNRVGLDRVASPLVIGVLKWGGQCLWITALLGGLTGIALLVRKQGIWLTCMNPLVWMWAYFAVTHAMIVIQDRYLFPATPMIAGLAAFAIVTVSRRPHEAAAGLGLGHRGSAANA